MGKKKTSVAVAAVAFAAVVVSAFTLYISVTGLAAGRDELFVNTGGFLSDEQSGNEAVAFEDGKTAEDSPGGDYFVYCENNLSGVFLTFKEALNFADGKKHACIKQKGVTNLLWDNYPPYNVFNTADESYEFETYDEALEFANKENMSYVFFRGSNSIVWERGVSDKTSAFINEVPQISQLPELPKGCEVTSLAMLINFMGKSVDKMTLAEEIAKNPEPHIYKDGAIHSGDPNDGFVGDMTSKNKFGLGVYHKPIFDLLSKYFPATAVDITGCGFEDIYHYINNRSPVWVIINSRYSELPGREFEKWVTPNGTINVTYREHSVLITGYDENYIYFNDPLNSRSSAPKADFIKAWEQMGGQAVSVLE